MDGWERLPGRLKRLEEEHAKYGEPSVEAFCGLVAAVCLIGVALQTEVRGYPLYLWLGFAVSVIGVVWGLYLLRDLRSWRSIAWLQIGLSVAAAVTSLLLTELSAAGVTAALAALFTGADGFKRLSEINKARN